MPALGFYADHQIQIFLIYKPFRVRTQCKPNKQTKEKNVIQKKKIIK